MVFATRSLARALIRLVAAATALPFRVARPFVYAGNRFFCPLCGGRFRRLLPFKHAYWIRGQLVDHYTENETCPRCLSTTRLRFLYSYILQKTDILEARLRVLHFAPEPQLARILGKRPNLTYVRCDIAPDLWRCDAAIDIGHIGFRAASFDVILCVHVLEHIVDDVAAMRELHRVLRAGGTLMLSVPIYGDATFEDPSLDEAARARTYGIGDHRRLNGLDLRDKLASAGFDVRVVSFDDVPGEYVDRDTSSPHHMSDRYLFACHKPAD